MRTDTPTLVREATVADADALGQVHAEAWQTAYRDLFEPDWLAVLTRKRRGLWASMMTAAEFERTTLLVAEHGDQIAAFAHFGPHRDGSADGQIYVVYAHPSVWGRGLAATLMDTVWDRLVDAGYPRVRVWTLAGSNRARAFYRRFGFTETGRTRETDYGDGRPVLDVEHARVTTPDHAALTRLPAQSSRGPNRRTDRIYRASDPALGWHLTP
jgi:GNAT superfamily N-acetyltransferase